MKIAWKNLIALICSLSCLIISMRVFYVQAIFIDEHNLSTAELYGGNALLYFAWFQLALLVVICVVSLIGLVRKKDA